MNTVLITEKHIMRLEAPLAATADVSTPAVSAASWTVLREQRGFNNFNNVIN